VDVSPSGGGIVKVDQTAPSSFPNTYDFESGTSVPIEAVPAPGYTFNNWSGDLSGTANPATIVIDCNKRITANFSKITHNLTIRVSGNGTTTPTPSDHDYVEGTVVNITVNPDSGWWFDRWIGEVSAPNEASTTVTMDSDKTITAIFSNIMHTLTIQINGSGSTNPTASTQAYSEGTLVNIEAIPDKGWQFDSWTGGVAGPSLANTTVTIDSDKTVSANFSQVEPNWWPTGGIIAGVIVIVGAGIWFVVRNRAP